MSKHQVIILLGVWVMVFLFLGFPFFLDKIIALVTGFLIITFIYSIRNNKDSERRSSIEQKVSNNSFVEHRGVPDRSITSDPTTTG